MVLLLSDLDIVVEADRVLWRGVVDEGCSSVCWQRRGVEDAADICEIFFVQSGTALAKSSRVDHDLGSCETQWVSRGIWRGWRKAKHLRRRSKRVESKRRGRITWLRSFFIHLEDGCKKMAVLRQQRYRYCRYEDERVSSLLGWQVSPDVRLNFNSSQAPIHISRHRLESRLTMDCSGARIQECESCLTEGYGDSKEGRRGGEDSEAPRHERTFKRL